MNTRAKHILPILALSAVLMAGCGDDDANPTAPGGGDQADWVALPVLQDTYIDDDSSGQNFGQGALLRLGPERHAFLSFDLQALPEDAVITGLRLHLTRTANEGATGAASVEVVWTADDGWEEDATTADDPPGMGSETLGNLPVDALAAGRQELVFQSRPALDRVHTEQLYLNRVLGLRLSSNQPVDFLSGEQADETVRPSIEVTYRLGTRVEILATEDAWTDANSAEANYDDRTDVLVGRDDYYTFVKFDLAGLPADARLEMVRFRMMANDGYAYGGDGNVYSYLVTDDSWSRAAITHATAPAPTGEHLGYWWLWYDGTDRDAWGANGSLLLRPVVQAEADGDGVLSLRLNSPGYFTQYYRHDDEDETRRPRLEVVYTR